MEMLRKRRTQRGRQRVFVQPGGLLLLLVAYIVGRRTSASQCPRTSLKRVTSFGIIRKHNDYSSSRKQTSLDHTIDGCSSNVIRALSSRGGAKQEDEESDDDDDDEEEEEESDDEDEEEEEEEEESDDEEDDDAEESTGLVSTSVTSTVLTVSKRVVKMASKVAVSAMKMSSRVIRAVFDSNLDEDGEGSSEELSAIAKVIRVVKRMWKAAWSTSETSTGSAVLSMEKKLKKKKKTSRTAKGEEKEEVEASAGSSSGTTSTRTARAKPDFGKFLATSYNVAATRDDLDTTATPILGGSISDALQEARSKARLLVVFIPSSKPSGKSSTSDQEAIKGFLSAEVTMVAEKKARSKGVATGSYVLWSAKAGSPEAVAALKRLKATQTNNKGQKRPVLLVAYPAQMIDTNTGVAKVVPRMLAQHHCNPPPSPEMMAAWLNALRKRHLKQYAIMQLELREAQLHKERQAGYKDSIQSDRVRQERERIEKEEKERLEKIEKLRKEAIQRRRKQLLDALPAEPDASVPAKDVKTIALRFADGRSSQRRFKADTSLSTLFDWVDAMFEMEREIIVLTTMNGKKSFSWDDIVANDEPNSLSDLSEFSGRMIGLRVTEKKLPTKSNDDEED